MKTDHEIQNETQKLNEIQAKASSRNLPVSTKHCLELCRMLRYRKTRAAKKMLEEVLRFERPVPFLKFRRDVAHKPGISSGRYPQKAARELMNLVKSVEANALTKNLNPDSLKITKLLANRAPQPRTGGRFRHGTKRTHLEIEVREIEAKSGNQEKLKNPGQKSQKDQKDQKGQKDQNKQPVVKAKSQEDEKLLVEKINR